MIEHFKDILKIGMAKKLKDHHGVYRSYCSYEYLEEFISTVLAENGHSNDWQPNRSHKMSVDITLDSGPTFSVKSGIYSVNKNTLKFSGSRLGKHKTLPEKVKAIVNSQADYYICVSKTEQGSSDTPPLFNMFTYYLFVFPATALNYDSNWQTTYSDKGNLKYFMEIDGMYADITPSMSHQLWTTLSTDLIGTPDKIDIILP